MAGATGSVVVLAGGVGGSRLVAGLAEVVDPGRLTVVVNTGDDFEHLGLWIQPDVDTVLYRLAGVQHPEHGWGRADATWAVMDAVAELEGPIWFRLGDQDLATSLVRTQWRDDRVPLGEVVARLAARLGVAHPVLPMSEDVVATRIHTVDGSDLAFQDWFVAHRAEPAVASLEFRGADVATPAPGVVEAIARAEMVVLAPSNPFLSIDPILSIAAIRDALQARSGPTVGVSPIVGGRALKGPAARLLADFGLEVSAVGVADHLGDVLTGFVLDEVDADRVPDVTRRGLRAWTTDTVMVDDQAQRRLATWLLDTAGSAAS